MKRALTLLLLLCITVTFAQKKSLSHEDYDLWKRVSTTSISNNGNVAAIAVVTATGAGDGYLEIHNLASGEKKTFFNGVNPQISPDEKYVYFMQKPAYEKARQEKKGEVKKDNQSKNTFMVYDVDRGEIVDSISRVKKFYASDKTAGYVIVEHHKDLKPEKEEIKETPKEKKKRLKKEKKARKKNKGKKDKKEKPEYLKEDYLVVYKPSTKFKDTITDIKDYDTAREGMSFIYSRKKGKDKKDHGVYMYNIETQESIEIQIDAWTYDKLSIDKYGKQAAYYVAIDSAETDSLKYDLHYLKDFTASPEKIAGTEKNIKVNWQLTSGRAPYFSENGKRLFFYTQPRMEYTIDTTLMDDEIAQVDVWNYKDRMTQPEQNLRKSRLKNKSTEQFYDTSTGNITNLNSYDSSGIMWDRNLEKDLIIIMDNAKYDVARSWEYPWRSDYYLKNVKTGDQQLLLSNSGSRPQFNPAHTHAIYYSFDDRNWHSINLNTMLDKNLTQGLGVAFHDVDDDHPALPPSYGFAGYDQDGNALLQDKFDLWKVDLNTSEKPQRITKGRENNITYRTENLDSENRNLASYLFDKMILSSFNHTTKESHIHLLGNGGIESFVEHKGFENSAFAKAKNDNTILYRKSNFNNYPDVYMAGQKGMNRLTDANPQQEDFKWGSVELFTWNAYDGKKLEGLIYKPEDFDPEKKYPMIVYFYEKYADRLHGYRSPQPSASTVNFSYLTSNDYVVFVPDIVYKDGHPGESAYNCIISGTEAVAQLGYVDRNAMALQGQSWGGYQTAYLVTRTNMYAAAMAGAPVSNMTSAYGGIRWGSGLSRAFQYERTQTRIGKNLWDGLDLYIENSPLFHIPKINTPLLMMHNDEDGAVPYYQGIEMFMGMRRLNKPVWLLVYNKEAHNLRKMKNKRDLSMRMMQFFDHYLKGDEAPVWMTQGLSADRKGKQMGYELDTNTPLKM
ncbi:MAG: alpha/beta hydrolase family protein [Nonlabens sp.]|uniref:alpha/beta hydrolase family protein n=1 Tax=Nonlabens sp. TaxID=1888209 RepID=UPI003EF73059